METANKKLCAFLYCLIVGYVILYLGFFLSEFVNNMTWLFTAVFFLINIMLVLVMLTGFIHLKGKGFYFFPIHILLLLNLISILHLAISFFLIFNIQILIVVFLCYLSISLYSVVSIYYAKINYGATKYIKYVILAMITIIISFSGIYSSSYQMCLSRGYDVFKINKGMSNDDVVMWYDFIYYSVDKFLAQNISDVSIAYLDYSKLDDKNSIMSRYVQCSNLAEGIVGTVKVFSAIQSFLFPIYISFIAASIPSKQKEVKKVKCKKIYSKPCNIVIKRKWR